MCWVGRCGFTSRVGCPSRREIETIASIARWRLYLWCNHRIRLTIASTSRRSLAVFVARCSTRSSAEVVVSAVHAAQLRLVPASIQRERWRLLRNCGLILWWLLCPAGAHLSVVLRRHGLLCFWHQCRMLLVLDFGRPIRNFLSTYVGVQVSLIVNFQNNVAHAVLCSWSIFVRQRSDGQPVSKKELFVERSWISRY